MRRALFTPEELAEFRTFRKAHRYAEELRSRKVNAAIMPVKGW